MKRAWDVVRSVLILHRVETLFFVAPLAAWGPVLACDAGRQDARLCVLAIVLNVGTVLNGFLGNSYCDYELDKRAPEKRRMTEATDLVGHATVLAMFVTEMVFLGALFYSERRLYASVAYSELWFWFGMVGRYLYNFPPFRLKERGFLNVLSYAVNFGVTPFCLAWSMFYAVFPVGLILVAVAGFLLMASQSLWGAAVDYDSDKGANAKTPAVVLGLRRSLRLSLYLMGLSVPLMVSGIYMLVSHNGLKATPLVLGVAVVSSGFAYSIVGRVRYVVFSEDALLQTRLQDKIRQLAWLVAQTGAGLAGLLVITAARLW